MAHTCSFIFHPDQGTAMFMYRELDRRIRVGARVVHDAVGFPFQRFLNSRLGIWIRRNTEPNHWTLLRFPLALGLAVLLYLKHDAVAFGVYLLAVLTDRFDGEFARIDHRTSAFGTLLDTVADSVMQGAVLLSLVNRYPALAGYGLLRLPIIAVALEVVRLLGGLILRIVPAVREREAALEPNMSGKFKMAALAFSVLAILLGHIGLANKLMAIAIILGSYSMLRHLFDALDSPKTTV